MQSKINITGSLHITFTVQMRDAVDSENSIITYREIKTGELYTFFLPNDCCSYFLHTYDIKNLPKIKHILEKQYKRSEEVEIATDVWLSLDGIYRIAIMPGGSADIFEVQYSFN
jgi:hypothetical protein